MLLTDLILYLYVTVKLNCKVRQTISLMDNNLFFSVSQMHVNLSRQLDC